MKKYYIILCVMISIGLQLSCMNQSDDNVIIPQAYWLIAAEIFGESYQESESALSEFASIKNEDVQPALIVKKRRWDKFIIQKKTQHNYTIQNYLDIDDNCTTRKEKDARDRKREKISAFLINENQDLSEYSQAIQDEMKKYAARHAHKRDRDKIYSKQRLLKKRIKKNYRNLFVLYTKKE